MADVKSSSWTCVSEGDKVAVFDDVSLVLMTPSPEEVLKNGEREDDSADGVIFRGCNDHRQNLTFRNSSSWFRIESAKNPMNGEDVYHVVKDVCGMASKELRINDRLVCLNDENTRVKSLQDVELMWELLKKSPAIKMGIWRWMYNDTGPQIYEVKIAFYNSQNPGSSKELSSLYLVRKSSRKVKNLKWKSYFKPFCLRIVCKTGTYVSANVEDLNLRGNTVNPPKNRYRFLLRFFKCMVQNEDGNMNMRSGFVGKFNINGKCYDISSAISELSSTVMLRPHATFNLSNPDERFFLTYKLEKDDDVFESLLYENMFMKFNIETETIIMHKRQERNPFFLFQRFVDRCQVLPTVDIHAMRTFSFVPLDDVEGDDSNDDNLDGDSDDNVKDSFYDS